MDAKHQAPVIDEFIRVFTRVLTRELVASGFDMLDILNEMLALRARVAELEGAVADFMFWFNSDGTPCEGFAFNEQRRQLVALLPEGWRERATPRSAALKEQALAATAGDATGGQEVPHA